MFASTLDLYLFGGATICHDSLNLVPTFAPVSVQDFSVDRAQFLPPWVLYFSGCEERDRLLEVLEATWKDIFQVGDHRGI